jgi:hypothetical protein
VIAVDLDLGEHRERDVVVRGGELEDLVVGAGLLRAELVAGEGEDGEAVRTVGLVERTQTCVLAGEASMAGDIDDEDDLAAVVGEVHLFAGDGPHGEVVQ